MQPSILHIQRALFAAAKRGGVSQDSFAAHLGVHRSAVSHFTTSGPQAKAMTVADLVALLEHVGEGQAAADVLGVIAAGFGCRVTPDEEVAAEGCRLRVLQETAEALAAVANPSANRDAEIRECREAAAELLAHADRLNANRAN